MELFILYYIIILENMRKRHDFRKKNTCEKKKIRQNELFNCTRKINEKKILKTKKQEKYK